MENLTREKLVLLFYGFLVFVQPKMQYFKVPEHWIIIIII